MSEPYTALEGASIDARQALARAIAEMGRARDLAKSAETKRALSVAITNAETALLWLRAATE